MYYKLFSILGIVGLLSIVGLIYWFYMREGNPQVTETVQNKYPNLAVQQLVGDHNAHRNEEARRPKKYYSGPDMHDSPSRGIGGGGSKNPSWTLGSLDDLFPGGKLQGSPTQRSNYPQNNTRAGGSFDNPGSLDDLFPGCKLQGSPMQRSNYPQSNPRAGGSFDNSGSLDDLFPGGKTQGSPMQRSNYPQSNTRTGSPTSNSPDSLDKLFPGGKTQGAPTKRNDRYPQNTPKTPSVGQQRPRSGRLMSPQGPGTNNQSPTGVTNPFNKPKNTTNRTGQSPKTSNNQLQPKSPNYPRNLNPSAKPSNFNTPGYPSNAKMPRKQPSRPRSPYNANPQKKKQPSNPNVPHDEDDQDDDCYDDDPEPNRTGQNSNARTSPQQGLRNNRGSSVPTRGRTQPNKQGSSGGSSQFDIPGFNGRT